MAPDEMEPPPAMSPEAGKSLAGKPAQRWWRYRTMTGPELAFAWTALCAFNWGLVYFVVPKFGEFASIILSQLPTPFRLLINLADFTRTPFGILASIVFLILPICFLPRKWIGNPNTEIALMLFADFVWGMIGFAIIPPFLPVISAVLRFTPR